MKYSVSGSSLFLGGSIGDFFGAAERDLIGLFGLNFEYNKTGFLFQGLIHHKSRLGCENFGTRFFYSTYRH